MGMYPITESVMALFEAEHRKVLRITGTDKNGAAITITDDNVLEDSFQIDRYSCNGEKLEVGTAIAAQMTFTLENGDGVYDGIVFEDTELFAEVGVADWTQENPTVHWVPCGYFTPDMQPRRLSTISITALDRMTKFDVVVDATDLTFPTTIAGLVGQVCTVCGVTLVQSIATLTNADVAVTTLPSANGGMITYRNLIQWCAGVMGTNAWFDWNGLLRFSWYNNATNYVSTMDNRYNSDLYENDLTVTGVEYTNDSGVVIVEGTDDYAIDLTGNAIAGPLIATVLPTLNTALNGFTYRPFTAAVVNAPYLWPMDVVAFTDKGGSSHSGALTNVVFGLNGTTALESKGMTYVINKAAQPKGFTREQARLINAIAQTAITNVDVEYAQNQSTTVAPTSGWSTDAPQWQDGYYIWQRTATTTDGGTAYSAPTCISGRDGVDGAIGPQGPQGIQGETGATGPQGPQGVGIASVTEYYALSNSGTTAPADSAFSTGVKTPTASNKYVWNYELITYTDSSTSKTTKHIAATYGDTGATGPQGPQGETGATGATGNGISSITEYYAVNNSTTAPADSAFSTTISQPTASNRYLWNYELITYTSGATVKTGKRVIGTYGETGATGPQGPQGIQGATGATGPQGPQGNTGATGPQGPQGIQGETGATGPQGNTGVGVSGIVEQYYLSTSSTTQTGGSWGTTQPAWVSGKYIWTRSQVTWTNGSTTYTTPVLAQAINGANSTANDARAAVTALDDALTQREIFNRLTDDGAAQGLVLYNGQLYVNASYINAGALNARFINFNAPVDDFSVPDENDPDSLLEGQRVVNGWIVNTSGSGAITALECDYAKLLRGRTVTLTFAYNGGLDYCEAFWASFDGDEGSRVTQPVSPANPYTYTFTVPDEAEWFSIAFTCSGIRQIRASVSGSAIVYPDDIQFTYAGLEIGRFTVDRSGNVRAGGWNLFRGATRFIGKVDMDSPLLIGSGGTGGNNAATARTNLDVYSKSEVNNAIQQSTAFVAATATSAHTYNNATINFFKYGHVAMVKIPGMVNISSRSYTTLCALPEGFVPVTYFLDSRMMDGQRLKFIVNATGLSVYNYGETISDGNIDITIMYLV